MVDEYVADVGHVLRSRGRDQVAALRGDRDGSPTLVGETSVAGDQAPILHPAQVLGQAALLPVQQTAEFERPQSALGCLREMGEDLVVGGRQPAPVAQLSI